MKKTIPVNVGKRLMFFILCIYSIGINGNYSGTLFLTNDEECRGVVDILS